MMTVKQFLADEDFVSSQSLVLQPSSFPLLFIFLFFFFFFQGYSFNGACLSTTVTFLSLLFLSSYTNYVEEPKVTLQRRPMLLQTRRKTKPSGVKFTPEFVEEDSEDEKVKVVDESKLDLFEEFETTSSSSASIPTPTNLQMNSRKYIRTRSVPNLALETPLSRVVRNLSFIKDISGNQKVREMLDENIKILNKPNLLLLPQRMHKCLSGTDETWCNYLNNNSPYIIDSQSNKNIRRSKSKLYHSKSFRFPKTIKQDDEIIRTVESDFSEKKSRTKSKPRERSSSDQTLEEEKTRVRTHSDSASSPNRFIFLPSLTAGKLLNNWNLDIFQLAEETKQRPLTWLLYFIFKDQNWFGAFSIDETKFNAFASFVEFGYNNNIPYHNNLHAADVVNSTYFLLFNAGFGEKLSNLSLMSGVIAAAVHDVKHPGRTARFLIHNRDPLAIRYNDTSVLEQMHLAETFEILSKEEADITSALSEKDYLLFRKNLIHSVLSTDLMHHLKTMTAVKQKENNLFQKVSSEEDEQFLLELALKIADVGHSTKNWKLHYKWSKRVQEEFYLQGDAEKELGLAISPHMDRSKPDIAQNQLSFFRFISLPLVESVALTKHVPEKFLSIYETALENEKEWEKLVSSSL